jgi:cardiolipin synthase
MPFADTTVGTTAETATELVRTAMRTVLVAGYDIEFGGLKEALIEKGASGIRVSVIGDRTRGGVRALWQAWPATATPLEAWVNLDWSKAPGGLMHAKVLAADRQRALVGSANFTRGGFGRNVEVGLKLEGTTVETICRLFDRLIREGWLERLKD